MSSEAILEQSRTLPREALIVALFTILSIKDRRDALTPDERLLLAELTQLTRPLSRAA